jgi:hypothetical protein
LKLLNCGTTIDEVVVLKGQQWRVSFKLLTISLGDEDADGTFRPSQSFLSTMMPGSIND